jgi:biopolymer transport protein ExbD
MARKKRELSEINAGSMADIAFLLLIFFLVTTTMDVDTGIVRMLPPPILENQPPPPPVNKRNVLVVLANMHDQLLIDDAWGDIKDLKEKAKAHIKSDPNNPDMPEYKPEDFPAPFGAGYPVSKQVISLQNDRGTSYNMYIAIQNELAKAYNELRDELAQEKFGKTYKELQETNPAMADVIRKIYPNRISEAEPKNIGAAQ